MKRVFCSAAAMSRSLILVIGLLTVSETEKNKDLFFYCHDGQQTDVYAALNSVFSSAGLYFQETTTSQSRFFVVVSE